jgi:mono/diheme cytochrome c family protein
MRNERTSVDPVTGWWSRATVIGAAAFCFMPAGHVVLAQADPAKVARGEKVYEEKKCAMCHMIEGKGGKSGGDLTDIGTKRDAEWLKRFTKNPRSVMPDAKMPAFKGSEDELDAVVAYMMSLK